MTITKTVTTTNGKGKKGKTTVSKTTSDGKKGKRQQTAPKGALYNTLTGHYQMLVDPCDSTLTESAYRGQAGIPSRFTRSWTITTGVNTAYYYQVNPADCGAMENQVLASSTAFTPVIGTLAAGRTFLLSTSSSFRVIGYCLDVDYIGTELNRSGKLYTGTVPSSNIPAGVATSIDGLKVLFPNNTRTPDKSLQSKWFPGVTNEDYSAIGGNNYLNSNNSVVFIAENMPAGIQLAFKETVVVEWIPLPNLGFVTPNALAGNNPPASFEQLHQAAKMEPSFTHSFMDAASGQIHQLSKAAGKFAVQAGARGLARLGAAAYRAAPLMLTM